MGFPSKKELEKIRKESEKWEGSLALGPNATPLEKFRYQICQELLRYKQDKDLSNVKMAKLLNMPEADLSRIFRHRIDGISTDRLLGLLEKLNPDHKIELKVS
jgi:hypothetical protein